MAKDKEQEALRKAEGKRRMLLRKERRRLRFLVKRARYDMRDGYCCEYGGGPDCDWSC